MSLDGGPSLRDLYLYNICLGKQEVALGKETPLYCELDEEVYVQLYSQKDTGRGHVFELPDEDVRFKADCENSAFTFVFMTAMLVSPSGVLSLPIR